MSSPVLGKRAVLPRRRLHRAAIDDDELDLDLTDLWDSELGRDRDHPPPPERTYLSLEAAEAAVLAHGKENGVLYKRQKWSRGGRYRLFFACNRSFSRRPRPEKPAQDDKPGPKRKRPGATSAKIGCPWRLWIVAVDYTNLAKTKWRVLHCDDRKSYVHNHPPERSEYAVARWRRETRTADMLPKLDDIFKHARDVDEALLLISKEFPETKWTRQDVKNELRRHRTQATVPNASPTLHPQPPSQPPNQFTVPTASPQPPTQFTVPTASPQPPTQFTIPTAYPPPPPPPPPPANLPYDYYTNTGIQGQQEDENFRFPMPSRAHEYAGRSNFHEG